ncbi:MAG TPA: FGGY-family carbohydrate kinase [Oscillospiraceae bacterium]|nr:FGGY-family carbohydrate kinase [Oscillospiraceae bacterium]
MEPLILSIDCGTQSLRAILFDKKGNIQAIERIIYNPPYHRPYEGFAEQDADFYYDTLCTAVKNLYAKNPKLFSKIKAVTVTTQRDSIVFLDKNNKPLRPCILWLDHREADMRISDVFTKKVISSLPNSAIKQTIEKGIRRSRAQWARQNEPEIWKKTYKYVLLSCYLNLKLTGNVSDSVASQIGYVPFNAKRFDWHKTDGNIFYRVFGVSKSQMPKLVTPGGVLGNITPLAARETGVPEGVPVIAAASDKGCETLGNGCLTEEAASVSFGTTATVEITTKKRFEIHRLVAPFPAAIKGYYNPEYEVFRGYWLVTWFKEEFASNEVEQAKLASKSVEEILNKGLSKIPIGSGGLMVQPYWSPELMLKDARGAIIGFNDTHTKEHIYRAIIEGINFALMDGMERIINKSRVPITRVGVAGGGSQNDDICQIAADMFGKPVYRVQTHETSGLGAAILGFVGIGEYENIKEAVANMVHYKDTFIPNTKNHRIYYRLYENVYKNMYPALKELYKNSKEALGK